MPTVRTEALIDAPLDQVWAALREWDAPHQRLAPGFLTDCRMDGPDRLITFFNGVTVRELLVDCDDEAHRLVWAVVEGPCTHDNAAAQLFPEPDGRTRFVWIHDFLPGGDELVQTIGDYMNRGTAVIKQTMETPAADDAQL